MSRSKTDLHNELVSAYDKTCAEYATKYPEAPKPFITWTHRTDKEQNDLYALGRTVKGSIVTNAKAGESPHNYLPAFAFDIAFITPANKLSWDTKHFKNFAAIIKGISDTIEWGGDWKFRDVPHFELKAWKQFKDLKHI